MNPIEIPGETRKFGAPVNWNPETQGSCGVLSVRDSHDGGAWLMDSWWQPNKDDILNLIAGNPIELRIYGNVHPVVSVAVVSRPDLAELVHEQVPTVDQLLKVIPDRWFVYSMGETVTPITYRGDKHEHIIFYAELQHRDGGRLTKGLGVTQAMALADAINKANAREKDQD